MTIADDRDFGALHTVGDRVLRGMAARFDLDVLALPYELATNDARPKVQRLFDHLNVFRSFDRESEPAQVLAVRVLAEPVEERGLPGGTGRIADLAAVGVVFGHAQFARRTIRRSLPAALRHGAQRQVLFIQRGEGLETGAIDGEAEFAVADRERRARIEGLESRVVARDDSPPIERALR